MTSRVYVGKFQVDGYWKPIFVHHVDPDDAELSVVSERMHDLAVMVATINVHGPRPTGRLSRDELREWNRNADAIAERVEMVALESALIETGVVE